MINIAAWEWDDGNEAELARHGLTSEVVEQIWLESPKFYRNKRRRAATYQMVGPDRGGTFWVVCILRHAAYPDV